MFFDTTIDADVGYATSAFHWSIGSDSGPEIVSELQWKKLRGPLLRVQLRTEWEELLFAFFEAEGMRASSGYVTDSDFEGENRTFMTDRAVCNAAGSLEGSLRLGLGGSLYFCYRTLKVEASCGYRIAAQHLKMFDGELIVSHDFDLGPIVGLNSSYNALWRGFEADVSVTKREGPCSAFINLNFFAPYYTAEGHWNLRSDFIDPFRQKTNDAFGITLRVGLLYFFNCWSAGITYQCQHFTAYHGYDMWEAIDGFGNTYSGMGRLNEVVMTTSSYTAHVGFVF